MDIRNGQFLLGDCFEQMAAIPDGSVDMVLCDLPYGTTQNKWDSVLPLDRLWAEYWRVCKPNAAVVLTAQTPFDKVLGVSQLAALKYEWVWHKPAASGHLNANRAPLKAHENALVFAKSQPTYNPQKEPGKPYTWNSTVTRSPNYRPDLTAVAIENKGERFPRSVLTVKKRTRHPPYPKACRAVRIPHSHIYEPGRGGVG